MTPMHFRSTLPIPLLLMFILAASEAFADTNEKIRILLVGDSTTIGNLPREVDPDGLHLEGMMEMIANAQELPALDVVNSGKSGETAARLLGSKWYDEHIKHVSDVDFIVVRMGINDWFKCDDFQTEFPVQMKALITQLRMDHADAEILLATICRFMSHEDCTTVNDRIKEIANEESLRLLDIYTPYNQHLTGNGPNSLNVRQPYLNSIPEGYREFLKPYSHFRKGWGDKPDGYVLKLDDAKLDPLFGHTKGWYDDRHPNSTGYNLIARETVKFLAPLLREISARQLDTTAP